MLKRIRIEQMFYSFDVQSSRIGIVSICLKKIPVARDVFEIRMVSFFV